jgi:hypothetical protein
VFMMGFGDERLKRCAFGWILVNSSSLLRFKAMVMVVSAGGRTVDDVTRG